MNARDLANEILPVDSEAIETRSFPDVWKIDFSTVPSTARRAARYALQLICKDHNILASNDLDPVETTWKLITPLIDQEAANAAFNSITHAEESPHKRVLLWQKRLILERPSGLMERLARDDGNAPTQHCVQILANTLGLNTTETRILDYLEICFSIDEFCDFTRAFESSTSFYNRQRLAAMLGVAETDVRKALLKASLLRETELIETRQRGRCDLEDFIEASTGLTEIFLKAPTMSTVNNLDGICRVFGHAA